MFFSQPHDEQEMHHGQAANPSPNAQAPSAHFFSVLSTIAVLCSLQFSSFLVFSSVSTALQNLFWSCMTAVFGRLDQTILGMIFECLVPNPTQSDNGIARSNRACNIVWRRNLSSLMRQRINALIDNGFASTHRSLWVRYRGESMSLLCDLADLCGIDADASRRSLRMELL